MLAELLTNFVAYPFVGTVLGVMLGMFSGLTVTGLEMTDARPQCERYVQCQNNADACDLASRAQVAFASINASTLSVLNALSDATGQGNIASQLDRVNGQCDWTKQNCPHPDPKGEDACARYNQFMTTLSPDFVKAWVGTTIAGAGIGLLVGVVSQIKECRRRILWQREWQPET